MIKQTTNSLFDQVDADFELRSILSSSSETGGLHILRETAFGHFKKLGFPDTKVEDWKYVNITPFLKDDFITEADDDITPVSDEGIARAKIKSLDCYHVILVNGKYRPDLSDIISCEGVFVSALSGAMNEPAFKAHFGR